MKKAIIPAIAGLVILSANSAWAWSDVSGTIKSMDASKHEIVLQNGKTYDLQADVKMSNLKSGDKIVLSTEIQHGKNTVNKVTKTT